MARPNKYEKWLTSDGLTLVEGWARAGLSVDQIAHNMGISKSTLCDWRNKFLELSDAVRRGREVVDFETESALLKRCLGGTYTTVRVEEYADGSKKTITTTVEREPDVRACIFWLTNRCKDRWKNDPDELRQELIDSRVEYYDSLTSRLRGDDVEIEDLSEADALIYGNSSDVVPGSWKPDQNDKNTMS